MSIHEEWFESNSTKEFMEMVEQLRLDKLEAIVANPNRDESCGIVRGIALIKSLFESAKKEICNG
jgi:hypothetical protein